MNHPGSRLARLYGLPKTHKEKLAMRPILSATQTYNYALAKWLDDKLKPLVTNQYMISDTFEFVNEVHELVINNGVILVSYDVSSLFTNVPLEETIHYPPTRLSLIIGLMKRTILISISWTLLIFLERQQRTNFSRSTASYMNRPTELLWAPPLVLC